MIEIKGLYFRLVILLSRIYGQLLYCTIHCHDRKNVPMIVGHMVLIALTAMKRPIRTPYNKYRCEGKVCMIYINGIIWEKNCTRSLRRKFLTLEDNADTPCML
jgi:hypothetical protein